MRIVMIMFHIIFFAFYLGLEQTVWANSTQDSYYATTDQQFNMEELEDLVAPIALYPDPLLAQILPAATFIDQINGAARYVGEYGNYARVEDQNWDVSVKAVAHYPELLYMMDQKTDWTVTLGQAFINQGDDLMYAIQLLRRDARKAGNLVSNQQQQVLEEDGYIRIVPTEPMVIYVPVYDPGVVYVERPSPGFMFVTFGSGFTIGAWLNRDCDWRKRHVFYHGWRGRDWIKRSRPHIRIRNSIYINKTNAVINTNQRVMQRDSKRFREQIRRDSQLKHENRRWPDHPDNNRSIPGKKRFSGAGPAPGKSEHTKPGVTIPHRDEQQPDKGQMQKGKTTPPPIIMRPDRDDQKQYQRRKDNIDNRSSERLSPPTTRPRVPTEPVTRDLAPGRDVGKKPPTAHGGNLGADYKNVINKQERTRQENIRRTDNPTTGAQQPSAPKFITPAKQPAQHKASEQLPLRERTPSVSGGKENASGRGGQPVSRKTAEPDDKEKFKQHDH